MLIHTRNFGIIKLMIKRMKNAGWYGVLPISKALAQGGSDDPGGSIDPGLTNPLEFDSIEGLLDNIADLLFTLSIPLLVIMLIIGGFYLLTAGGSEQKVSTGKKVITWAIIGFVVILVAGSVASLIRNLLEG